MIIIFLNFIHIAVNFADATLSPSTLVLKNSALFSPPLRV